MTQIKYIIYIRKDSGFLTSMNRSSMKKSSKISSFLFYLCFPCSELIPLWVDHGWGYPPSWRECVCHGGPVRPRAGQLPPHHRRLPRASDGLSESGEDWALWLSAHHTCRDPSAQGVCACVGVEASAGSRWARGCVGGEASAGSRWAGGCVGGEGDGIHIIFSKITERSR